MGQLAAVPVEQQLLKPPGPNHLSTIGLQNISKGCVAILEKKVPNFSIFTTILVTKRTDRNQTRTIPGIGIEVLRFWPVLVLVLVLKIQISKYWYWYWY